MLSKTPRGPGGPGMHTAGIYADMTVDGPEIGTLVMIIDRAKNLPNRRTMGKQNPYCAARLGKEAKKTDTDMRGGQTPRWDQELRFTVHDSPDYNNLKVSVFNDDKKTDLIGETLINLEEVLLPGGGQGDQWHSLNCKGRYAGEIRIELTYYDSRPKTERSKDKGRKYSATDLANLDQQAAMASTMPQSTVKRRPLPSDPTGSTVSLPHSPNIAPMLRSGLRSYHAPPLQDPPAHGFTGQRYNLTEIGNHNSQSSSSFGNARDHRGLASSLPSSLEQHLPLLEDPDLQHGHDSLNGMHQGSEHFYDESLEQGAFEDYDIPVTDDPYALEAVNSQTYLKDHEFGPQSMLPRNHRVLELSGSPLPRPSPNIPLPHAHSAPSLGSNEHYQDMDNDFYDNTHEWTQNEGFGSPVFADKKIPSSHHKPIYTTKPHESAYEDDTDDHCIPPPPPVHRNSAPAVTRLANHPNHAQNPIPVMRPIHSATSFADFPAGSTHGVDHRDDRNFRQQLDVAASNTRQFSHNSPNSMQQLHHRHLSADGLASHYHDPYVRAQLDHLDDTRHTLPAGVVAFQPRRSLGPTSEGPTSQQQMSDYARSSPPGPSQYDTPRMYENRSQPQTRTTPLIKPRAVSPNRGLRSTPFQPHHITPKNSTTQMLQKTSQSAVPYSPDSFTVFNPKHSNPSTPNGGTSPGIQRELSPMYHNAKVTPTQPQLQSPSPAPPEDEVIIGSDGKVKDPTDHLPPSSYAPEPERKGNRPSIVVNQRNRFGPREARPVPVNTRQQHSAPSTPTALRTSALGSNTQQSPRLTQQHSRTGSPLPRQDVPLSPQHSVWDGASHITQPRYAGHGFGYDRVEIFAPPIPAKIPLDSRGEGSQMLRADDGFGRDIARLSLDGTGDTNMGTVYGGRGGATRPRRSRFGA